MKHKWTKRAIVIVLMVLFFYWQNNGIVTTHHTYTNEKIPASFDGYKVVQVSDLHNKAFGKDQRRLISEIIAESPDAIFVTGDLIDSRHPDVEVAMQFIEKAIQIAPVYYVSGNHEFRVPMLYNALKSQMTELGVVVLENQSITLKRKDAQILLIGVDDPQFQKTEYEQNGENAAISQYLASLRSTADFKILLSHRPELLDLYSEQEVDVVFSGHAHGGQFRLPFIGGLGAPNQGFFPKLTSGRHDQGETTLYISRGLGNSIIPIRLFNRPELIVVTFHSK